MEDTELASTSPALRPVDDDFLCHIIEEDPILQAQIDTITWNRANSQAHRPSSAASRCAIPPPFQQATSQMPSTEITTWSCRLTPRIFCCKRFGHAGRAISCTIVMITSQILQHRCFRPWHYVKTGFSRVGIVALSLTSSKAANGLASASLIRTTSPRSLRKAQHPKSVLPV